MSFSSFCSDFSSFCSALQYHPREPSLWIFAANYEQSSLFSFLLDFFEPFFLQCQSQHGICTGAFAASSQTESRLQRALSTLLQFGIVMWRGGVFLTVCLEALHGENHRATSSTGVGGRQLSRPKSLDLIILSNVTLCVASLFSTSRR